MTSDNQISNVEWLLQKIDENSFAHELVTEHSNSDSDARSTNFKTLLEKKIQTAKDALDDPEV